MKIMHQQIAVLTTGKFPGPPDPKTRKKYVDQCNLKSTTG
jgi:hypothetical protein